MSRHSYDITGVVREWWDDNTRTYHEYDEHGVEIVTDTLPRDYTAEENAAADTAQAEQTRVENETTLRSGLALELQRALDRQTELNDEIISVTNPEINNNPAAKIKVLARMQRRSENALMRLVRLVGDLTDSADIGSDQ